MTPLPLDEEIAAYVHGALDEQATADFERRLREDADLRQRVARVRQLQQAVRSNLIAAVEGQPIPPALTFDAIAADVQRRRPAPLRLRLVSALAVLGALLILSGAVLYSLGDPFNTTGSGATPTPALSAPALQPIPPPETTPQPTPSADGPTTLITRTPTPTATAADTDGPTSLPLRTPTAGP